MARVNKRIKSGKTYYYLEHTIREKGEVKKEEKYLGKHVPKNIEEVKKEFVAEIYRRRWIPLLESIRKNYRREEKTIPPTLREKQSHQFSIRFTYDTNRIEGSKLTLRETADLLERGITPKNKPLADVKEAEAHEKLFTDILEYKKDLTLQTILYWHKRLFEPTKPDIAGNVRSHQVAISGSKFMPPSPVELNPLLSDYFRWYNKNKEKLNPVELAALAHLKLVTIHPFADGNGRISRLAMNFILNKKNYPLLNIPYENRTSYYNALERSQTKKQDHIFTHWLIKRYLKQHKQYIR